MWGQHHSDNNKSVISNGEHSRAGQQLFKALSTLRSKFYSIDLLIGSYGGYPPPCCAVCNVESVSVQVLGGLVMYRSPQRGTVRKSAAPPPNPPHTAATRGAQTCLPAGNIILYVS